MLGFVTIRIKLQKKSTVLAPIFNLTSILLVSLTPFPDNKHPRAGQDEQLSQIEYPAESELA